jgi:membrane dipeptidase
VNVLKKIIFYSLIFLIVENNFLCAQQISGTIKDELTKLPVKTAKVEIVFNSSGYKDSVFTNSNGVWIYNLATAIEDDEYGAPRDFVVYQNYPNPFNPSTTIRFAIFKPSNVRLTVHNILGELIDIKDLFLDGGIYDIEWYSKGSAGVYLYTISFGEQSITKKMIQLDGGNVKGFGNVTAVSNNFNKPISKTTSQDILIIYSKRTHISDTVSYTVNGGENFLVFLKSIHSTLKLIDLHNDVLEVMAGDPTYHLNTLHTYNHTDIPRLKNGSVDVQFFSVWVSPDSTEYTNYFERAQQMLSIFNTEMSQNQNNIQQAFSPEQTLQINDAGKIAAVIGVEGGHYIENSLSKLQYFYNAGMRYMTITWNNSTDWAISAKDGRTLTQGLTNFGRQVIRKLDSLGVIIDVSHVGIKTIQDILQVTTHPIIATHSGARAIRNHYRNLYDWQIQAIANSGGVIGVVFYPYFLNGTSNASVNDVIQHIDYIKNLVGINYIAVGSDFDGIEVTPVGLEDVSKFSALTDALIEHGYSVEDIEKILSKNFQRVFEQVCGQ